MTSPLLWLIGGTTESATLAAAIAAADLPCLVTVTTEAARSLYSESESLRVWVGRLRTADLSAFLQTHRICGILDASHPFAAEVSRLAIDAAARFNLPYLRFERSIVASTQSATSLTFESFEALLASEVLTDQRVLLTLGYKHLPLFGEWHTRAVLFARILPSVTALEAALAAGFTADRLVALRPPVSIELERALWRQWQISLVVTKASGTAGGEEVKRQLAETMGVRLAVIDRPPVNYPQQTSDVAIGLAFCRECLNVRA